MYSVLHSNRQCTTHSTSHCIIHITVTVIYTVLVTVLHTVLVTVIQSNSQVLYTVLNTVCSKNNTRHCSSRNNNNSIFFNWLAANTRPDLAMYALELAKRQKKAMIKDLRESIRERE